VPCVHLERIDAVRELPARVRAKVRVAGAVRDVDLIPILK